MFKRLLTASLLCAGAAVLAQQAEVIGKVTGVQGVVTISDGVTVVTAVPGTPIIEGNQFVTAPSGAAVLTLDNGCEIKLKPNESLIVDGKRSCRALIASIQPVGGNVAAAGVSGGAAARLVGAGALLAAALTSDVRKTPAAAGGGDGTGGGGGIPVLPISGQ